MKIVHYCNKIIEYSFYALFFFVPLIFWGTTSELFELNKMWLTWILTLIIAGAWFSRMIIEKQIKILRTPLDIPIILFLISQIISTVISMDSYVSFWGYYSRFNGGLLSTITYIFLYYAFVSTMLPEDTLQKVKEYSMRTRSILYVLALSIPFLALLILPLPDKTTYIDDMPAYVLFFSFFISFLLVVLSYPSRPLKRLLFVTLTAGLFVVLWGIPSHFGKDPTCYTFRHTMDVSCWTEAFRPTIRMFSTLGQPAWLAAYLAILTPLAIGFYLKQFKKAQFNKTHLFFAAFFFVLTQLFYISQLFANTRAGFIGLWIGIVLFWLMLFLKKIFSYKFLLFSFFLFTISFLICHLLFDTQVLQLVDSTVSKLTNQTPQIQKTNTTKESNAPSANDQTSISENINITDSGKIRILVWQGATDAWKANPLFGTGVETFAFAYYKYRPIEHNLTSEWDYLYNKAHNEYLNYLTTTGLFGLGTYLLLIGFFIFQIIREVYDYFARLFKHNIIIQQYNNSTISTDLLVIGLFSGWISMLITNFFGFSVVITNLFLFLIPAFIFVLQDNQKRKWLTFPKNRLTHDHPSAKSANVSHISVSQWFSTGVLSLLILYFIVILFIYWQADKQYGLGYNLDRNGYYQDAYQYLTKAVDARPSEPVYQDELSNNAFQYAYALFKQKDKTNPAHLAQQAVDINTKVLSEHPSYLPFWKTRIRIFYTLGQINPQYYQTARLASQEAASRAPTDAKIWYNYGVITSESGDYKKAVEILQKTLIMKPDYIDAQYALGLTLWEYAKVNKENKEQTRSLAIQTMEELLQKDPKNEQAKKTLDQWLK